MAEKPPKEVLDSITGVSYVEAERCKAYVGLVNVVVKEIVTQGGSVLHIDCRRPCPDYNKWNGMIYYQLN